MYNFALYLITIAIWGSTWLGIKFQIGVVPPMQSVAYRFLLAGILMQIVLVLLGRLKWFSPRAHLQFVVLGASLFCWNYVLMYVATETGLTTGLIAVLFSLLITMNILNSALFFGERPRPYVLGGAATGLLGIALLFAEDLAALRQNPGLLGGMLAVVAGTYLASLGNMMSKRLQRQGVNVTAANGWSMTYGGLMLLAVVLALPEPLRFDPSPTYVITLVLLAVMGSLVAFWSYLTLLGRVGAEQAAYAMIVFPIWALVLSWMFEGFIWSPLKLSGVAIVLLGNLIVSGRLRLRRPSVATPAP
ncbi:MAG: EamA family transporter [Paracoccaceae bacterium]